MERGQIEGFLIKKVVYSDSKLILQVYTRELGLISGSFRHSKKTRTPLQVGNQIRVSYTKRGQSDLYGFGSIQNEAQQHSSRFVQRFPAISFICEILSKSLGEETPDIGTYDLVRNGISFAHRSSLGNRIIAHIFLQLFLEDQGQAEPVRSEVRIQKKYIPDSGTKFDILADQIRGLPDQYLQFNSCVQTLQQAYHISRISSLQSLELFD